MRNVARDIPPPRCITGTAPSRPFPSSSPPPHPTPTARPTDRLASCQHVVSNLRELGVLGRQLGQQRLELGDFALRAGQLIGAEGRRAESSRSARTRALRCC